MLKGVHRSLMPEGTLHLTLIDPMPVSSSLGPHMRTWIEKHLLLNLEKNFRCVNPSKLFPHWLAESHLRGQGSTISTAKFWAVPPGRSGARGTPDARSDDRSIMMELRGAVGRMLWTEAWGMYVGAQRWWWEEPECVKECLQLGTHWEYYLIEGVKEG
ncbi:uncharacterized protein DNG_01866 [Cephalotrichum gorgonifer]|uniref:Uncharacterized protein n=1 Tax=Cephalotrichum gorgonifer TaxID=2041049 RepID=A0AAE8MSL0_9PEZI|nr:uncharacterized protein DNG_01866 [Cephalotrichum gorgonifer]